MSKYDVGDYRYSPPPRETPQEEAGDIYTVQDNFQTGCDGDLEHLERDVAKLIWVVMELTERVDALEARE